jgi:carbonic anhydrase/acetyltransferase-like protein (isoleucine patch superfamily)
MTVQIFENNIPQTTDSVLIDQTALVIGHVILNEYTSIRHTVLIRGDKNFMHAVARTNIQDRSVLHKYVKLKN